MPFPSIASYHEKLYSGGTNCTETVNLFLKQIKNTRHLNAFIEVYEEESIRRAQELDHKRRQNLPLGKLHGVIIALKDVICYKDHKVTAASAILKDFTSIYSATAVERLLAEDAIIIGNCNCDEFAMGSTNENSYYGPVKNALDESKVPGGSSGGSAVAVQAGLCMVSLGSDTGGSVRQPADFCGILGYKPSYGTVSRNGLLAYASSFDQIGIFANYIDDVFAVLEVIAGPDKMDSTANKTPLKLDRPQRSSNNKTYRIALLKNAMDYPGLDAEIKHTIQEFSKQLPELCTVEEVEFELIDYIVPAYYILTTAEASSNLSRYDGVRYGYRAPGERRDLTDFYKTNRGKGFGNEVKKRIMLGTFVLSEGYYDAYYTKAQQVRRMLVQQTEKIFASYDAIFLPTAPTTAFEAGSMTREPIAMYLADIYTVYANLTGLPAISLPLFNHSNGMPFGLQVLTNRDNELTLLELSDKLMEANVK